MQIKTKLYFAMKFFRLHTFLVSLLAVICFVSCTTQPPTPEELYKEQASGVVLVLNKFYYNIALPNGEHLYFTGIEQDGTLTGLTDDVNEIRQNCGNLMGTAFFIDKNGTLLTNRHVAQPYIDASQVKLSLMNIIRYAKALYEQRMNELSAQYDALQEQKAECVTTDYWGEEQIDQQRYAQLDQQQAQVQQQYYEASQERNSVENQLDPANITIHSICQLGIAYNDSYVTSEADFLVSNPCNLVRVSQDENTDLALIQLRSAHTPDNSFIFSVDGKPKSGNLIKTLFQKNDNSSAEKLKIDQQLYMIGFNAGIELANTRKGIKVQMTGGRVTQLPDGERLLYSIPAMQGSSGSPVIDAQGCLVGVNFAKMNNSDNFNFGIPLKKVRQFVKQ